MKEDGRTLADYSIQKNARLRMQRIDQVCFQAGTLITMADGTEKAIETITEGDLVLSWNHQQEEFCCQPVIDVFSRAQAECIVAIATKDLNGNCIGRPGTDPILTGL